jgi:hypothetical protein
MQTRYASKHIAVLTESAIKAPISNDQHFLLLSTLNTPNFAKHYEK